MRDQSKLDCLPEGWAQALLGEGLALDVQPGFACGRHSRTEGVPHLRPMNVSEEGRIDLGNLKFVPKEEANRDERLLRVGDVLFNNTNSPELVGKTACYKLSEARAFSNHMTRIRCRGEALDPEFCAMVLHAKWMDGYFASICNNHVSQASISRTVLLETPIPLPSFSEQKRIVAKVEELLACVNAALQRLAKVPAILKRFRQSVLAAACSGRLTADWRELNPATATATTLLDLIRSQSASRNSRREALEKMEELPASWCRAYFEELTENHDGKRIPVKADDRAKRRGKYPYYGASGIIDTIDDYLFDGRFLLIGEDGANLLSRSTPIAFQATGQFWVNNHAHIIQARCGIPLEYLEIFVNGLDLQDCVTGSAQPKLTQAALNRVPVPLPPLPEQHEIVRRVEALFKLADAIEKRVAAATARAEKLTQAILAKAFRGELVPTEAELARREGRDYEPASVLLERIRTERSNSSSNAPKTTKQPRRVRQ